MPSFKIKKCKVCGKEYLPTGPCSYYCSECSVEQHKKRQCEGQFRYREKLGKPTHVGKGGSNKKFTDHPQYISGICNFQRLRKELYAEIKECQICGRDLTSLGTYEKCVHHLDHDRTHNVKENLIVICKRCHQLHHNCEQALPQFRKVQRLSERSRGKSCSEAQGSSI